MFFSRCAAELYSAIESFFDYFPDNMRTSPNYSRYIQGVLGNVLERPKHTRNNLERHCVDFLTYHARKNKRIRRKIGKFPYIMDKVNCDAHATRNL